MRRRIQFGLVLALLVLELAGCTGGKRQPAGGAPEDGAGPTANPETVAAAAVPGAGSGASSAAAGSGAATPGPAANAGNGTPGAGGSAATEEGGAAPGKVPLVLIPANEWGIKRLWVEEGRDEGGSGYLMEWDLEPATQEVVVTADWARIMVDADDVTQLTAGISPPGAARFIAGPGPLSAEFRLDPGGTAAMTVTRIGNGTFTLQVRRADPPMATMSLAGAPHVQYTLLDHDAFPTVPPGPQELRIAFTKPANRASVEAALVQNLGRGSGRYENPGQPPPLAFEWQDDRNLTVRFTVPQNETRPPMLLFGLAGAVDQDGARFGDRLGVAFHPGWWHTVWRLVPGREPVRVGRMPECAGQISPDGRYAACSEITYAMGDGWGTVAWLTDLAGRRRYLGGGSDYVTWMADGLLLHGFAGHEPRLIPGGALDSPDPQAAARPVPIPEGRRLWDLTPEPGGSRLALWLIRDPAGDAWPPHLDLLVPDPGQGDWQVDNVARGRTSDGFPQREPAAFGPDGALYWIELPSGDNATGPLWRLTRDGRQQVHPGPLYGAPMTWAGGELALDWQPSLLNPLTGEVRPLPAGADWSSIWVSPDGQWLARGGAVYRRSDLSPVGSWGGTGLGFDAASAFYYTEPEPGEG